MRAFFLVNALSDLKDTMTTTRMCIAAARLGVETWVVELDGLGVSASGLSVAEASRVQGNSPTLALGASPEVVVFHPGDKLIVRLNPARFGQAAMVEFALWHLRYLQRSGVVVLNSPDSIERVASKAFLSELPSSLRPTQAVAANLKMALASIEEVGPEVVVKPVRGTRGRGVVFMDQHTMNPSAIIELLLEQGPVVIQERLHAPKIADVRVVLVNGRPLEVDGVKVAIQRTAPKGELRSNLHLGGEAEVIPFDQELGETMEALRPFLDSAKLSIAGVDVMCGKVLELNVWAPGGIGPFERLTGSAAALELVRALLL